MAFFPRTLYNSDASFTPLFRLLEDFDKYSRNDSSSDGNRRSQMMSWQPKFDVRETSDAYHFHGELPGLTKDQISIEFPDEQAMVISGRTERTYTSGTPPAGLLDSADKKDKDDSEHRNSHQATVEDESNDNNENNKAVAAKDGNNNVAKKQDGAKYWVSERSIGEFSRHFNFPSRVDQDGVTASLNDGILTVDVPKAKKREARRIAVN